MGNHSCVRDIGRAVRFLEDRFPTRAFLPALGVKLATLHEYNRRGLLSFEQVGRGKVLYLSGTEILYARCLSILSMAGCTLKYHTKGLRSLVTLDFPDDLQERYSEAEGLRPYFVFYRVVSTYNAESGRNVEGEWGVALGSWEGIYSNYLDPNNKKRFRHIVESTSQNPALPFVLVMELTEILVNLSNEVYARL